MCLFSSFVYMVNTFAKVLIDIMNKDWTLKYALFRFWIMNSV